MGVLGWWLQVPNWSKDDLQDILSDALSQAWTPAQEAVLNSETGVESVIDAVVRVSAQVICSSPCCPYIYMASRSLVLALALALALALEYKAFLEALWVQQTLHLLWNCHLQALHFTRQGLCCGAICRTGKS